jgi:hypothetical protein
MQLLLLMLLPLSSAVKEELSVIMWTASVATAAAAPNRSHYGMSHDILHTSQG